MASAGTTPSAKKRCHQELDGDGSDQEQGEAPDARGPPTARKELDTSKLEVLINRTERTTDTKNLKLKSSMEDMLQVEFQAHAEKHRLASELSVLQRRMQWLRCVMKGQEADLTNLLQMVAEDAAKGEACDTASSKQLNCRARAGPCSGFENLKIFGELDLVKQSLRGATSQNDLKARSEASDPLRKLFGVLTTSCRTALGDLTAAVNALRAEEEGQKKAEEKKKQETNRKRKDGVGNTPGVKKARVAAFGVPAALSAERSELPDIMKDYISTDINDHFMLSLPFLWTGQVWLQKLIDSSPVVAACFKDVAESFSVSSIRVTEGRCQQRMPDGVQSQVLDEMSKILLGTGFLLGPSAAGPADVDYTVVQSTSVYAFAAGAISAGRFELRQLACLRLQIAGTREVAMVNSLDVISFLKSEQPDRAPSFTETVPWFNAATESDIKAFFAAGHRVWWATFGVAEMVYVPAGWIISHRVMNAKDCIGLRVGCVSIGDTNAFNGFIKESLDKPNLAMNQAAAIAARDSDRLLAVIHANGAGAQQPGGGEGDHGAGAQQPGGAKSAQQPAGAEGAQQPGSAGGDQQSAGLEDAQQPGGAEGAPPGGGAENASQPGGAEVAQQPTTADNAENEKSKGEAIAKDKGGQ